MLAGKLKGKDGSHMAFLGQRRRPYCVSILELEGSGDSNDIEDDLVIFADDTQSCIKEDLRDEDCGILNRAGMQERGSLFCRVSISRRKRGMTYFLAGTPERSC